MKLGVGWTLFVIGFVGCGQASSTLRSDAVDASTLDIGSAETTPVDVRAAEPAGGPDGGAMLAVDASNPSADSPAVPPDPDDALATHAGDRDAAASAAGGADGSSGNGGRGGGNGMGSAPLRDETLTILDQGRSRTVLVHAPAHGPGLFPLVFSLHGSGETAAGQRAYTNLDESADAHGFIAVYPQGAIVVGSGFAWNVTGQVLTTGTVPPADSADDNNFFRHAITVLSERYPVDPSRIFASGFSGGARMTSQIGCELSTLVAAVSPFAGLRYPTPCTATRAVPVITFHGTADMTNPYDGGGSGYWTYSVPIAAQRWASHDVCADSPAVSTVGPEVELTSYTGCADGAVVNLYTITGMGHEVPGVPGGNPAIAGTEVMWRFFAAHPLP